MNAIPATTRSETSVDARQMTGNRLPEAFEQLFIAEYPRVVAIANRVLANRHEAEEVAQEVFLSFHKNHDPQAPYARPWLYRAASHSALNVVRGNKRRVVRERALLRGLEPGGDGRLGVAGAAGDARVLHAARAARQRRAEDARRAA